MSADAALGLQENRRAVKEYNKLSERAMEALVDERLGEKQ